MLWEHWCTDYTWRFVGWDWDPRDPTVPPEACFRFDQLLPEDHWFLQEEGDNIYWISIAAAPDAGVPPDYPWGWKTRPRDPASSAPDDAVVIFDPLTPSPGAMYQAGAPIFWPTPADSWDMAFQLTTLPTCIPADVNCDSAVNGLDIAAVKAPGTWQQPVGGALEPRADVNGDGNVNGLDIAAIKAPGTWSTSTGPCNCP